MPLPQRKAILCNMLMRRQKSESGWSGQWRAVVAASRQPLSPIGWMIAAAALIFLAYNLVFLIAGRGLIPALTASLRNLLTLAIVVPPFGWLIATYVRRIGGIAEFATHMLLAILFAYLWFFLLMIAIGRFSAMMPTRRFGQFSVVAVRLRMTLGPQVMLVEIGDQFLGFLATDHADDRVQLGLGAIVILLRRRRTDV